MNERRRILYLLTPAEREMYHALGGCVPREIPPCVVRWWQPGEELDVQAATKLVVANRQQQKKSKRVHRVRNRLTRNAA